jgi:hypothetical protein
MTDTIVVDDNNNHIIVQEDPTYVIVQEDSTTVLVQEDVVRIVDNTDTVYIKELAVGPQGPPGVSGEDAVPYDKLIDFVDDDHIYIGEADPGSATSSGVWRIKYIVIQADGDSETRWADGVATFSKVWDDRASYGY